MIWGERPPLGLSRILKCRSYIINLGPSRLVEDRGKNLICYPYLSPFISPTLFACGRYNLVGRKIPVGSTHTRTPRKEIQKKRDFYHCLYKWKGCCNSISFRFPCCGGSSSSTNTSTSSSIFTTNPPTHPAWRTKINV